MTKQTSFRSRRSWVGINIMYSFYLCFYLGYVEKFQSTEVRIFCLKLRVIGAGNRITISRAVDTGF